MATTVTFASANQPRIVAGTETVEMFQKYAGGVGTSATSPVHFKSILIPHGATIMEIGIHHRGQGTTVAFGHNVGLAGGITSAALFGSESFSATTLYVNMMASPSGPVGISGPYKVSCSQDAALQYVWPTVTSVATGTNSVTVSFGVYVRWSMNKTNATAQ